MSVITGLTPSQAARLLGLSVARVHQLIALGRLPAVRTPLGHLISEDAVEALRREREARKGGVR